MRLAFEESQLASISIALLYVADHFSRVYAPWQNDVHNLGRQPTFPEILFLGDTGSGTAYSSDHTVLGRYSHIRICICIRIICVSEIASLQWPVLAFIPVTIEISRLIPRFPIYLLYLFVS